MNIKHEQPHEPSADEHAQESWYFNWTDRKHDMFGLARTGFKYHAQQPEPLIMTITGKHLDFIYPLVPVPKMTTDWNEIDATQGLIAGDMTVTMEEPFKLWRIVLKGENSLNLQFEAYTPVFNYNAHSGELASTMTTEHFEQSCRVTGWLEFHGNRREIDGYGQRDKSWGVRAWPEIVGWDWISAQFGEEMSFNVMRTQEKMRTFLNGFVYRDGRNFAITDASIDYEWGEEAEKPIRTHLEIVDESTSRHLITAETRGSFSLPKSPVVLEETYSIFTYHDVKKPLEGGGMVEHVWRPEV